MTTLKICLLTGVVASIVAVGLLFLEAAIRGSSVEAEHLGRSVILSFVVTATAVGIVRHKRGA